MTANCQLLLLVVFWRGSDGSSGFNDMMPLDSVEIGAKIDEEELSVASGNV